MKPTFLITCAFVAALSSISSAAVLEVPQNGGNVSGVGYFSGWKCPPNDNISISIDGDDPISVPSRVRRGDTAGACGNDGRNGFITQINFGLLGNGFHTVAVRQGGQTFATSTFNVTTFGVPFLTGASGSYVLPDFPTQGKTATVTWSQGTQSFVVTSTSGSGPPSPTPTAQPQATPTPGGATGLRGMIGTWDFSYTIISTFTDRYFLPNDIRTIPGYPVLVGEDEIGGPVVLSRVQDVTPGSTLPYEFIMLNESILLCKGFVFNRTGNASVAGRYTNAFYSNGECGTFFGDYPMTGVRISTTAAGAERSRDVLGARTALEQRLAEEIEGGETVSAEVDELLHELSRQVAVGAAR